MILGAIRLLALFLFAGLAGEPAMAQQRESFEIGLSTDRIAITSNFNGARLVIFGVLDNADYELLRQGRYDIVVALEGPRRPVVVRKKARVLGLWINRDSESFETAPASYSLASTRRLTDATREETLRQLSLGTSYLRLGLPRDAAEETAERDEFEAALRHIRETTGLYTETYGSVDFVSSTLFRADLALPADLPVGQHMARAFLFRDGIMQQARSEPLWVVKTGLESLIQDYAVRDGYLYGVFAVFLAIFTGWFGRIVFKRD
ncbi:TIGR02186 family protein [Consotaella aegiceratis]|uniref:TIGR02186 family protein n=1 Tax=Consotaella aegiceratis TaxID=3097961 RepID=UPI002F41301B